MIGFVLGTGRSNRATGNAERKSERVRNRRRHRAGRRRWARAVRGSRSSSVHCELLPGASYLAALDGIHKLNYSKAEDVLLVVLVNVIMLSLIEVPSLN